MKKLLILTVVITAGLLGSYGYAANESAAALPIPEVPAAADVPGAHELADPSLTYKIVFTVKAPAPKIDQINPGLIGVARYVNTLAKDGVPADHRKIVVVFNGDEIFLKNDAYKTRNDGHDNPNIALIQSMKKAGIDMRVCGQELVGRKIDPSAVLPEIQVDQWAMTTVTNFESRGYIFVPTN